MQGRKRAIWIESISRHHEHDFFGYFTICEHHFKTDDFLQENGMKFLKEGAIPSVFEEQSYETCDCSNNDVIFNDIEYSENSYETVDGAKNDTEKENIVVCKECVDLNMDLLKASKKITSLEKKVLELQGVLHKVRKENTKLQKKYMANSSTAKVR